MDAHCKVCGGPTHGEVVVWSQGPRSHSNPAIVPLCVVHHQIVVGFVADLIERQEVRR